MAAAPMPPTPNAAPADAPLSQIERIVDAFIAPRKLFTDIRRSAAWWAPWLLISIFSVAFFYVVNQKVGFRKVAEFQVHQSPKAERQIEQLPPDQQETAMKQRTVGTRVISYAAPATIIIIYLIMGGLLFAIFKFGVNANIKFGQTLAILFYAGLPGILKMALSIVSLAAGAAPDAFDINNPVATNPGYFLDAAQVGAFMHVVLTFVDVFLIWTIVLSSIGFSVVGKIKLSTSMIVNFGFLLVLVLIAAGATAAFS